MDGVSAPDYIQVSEIRNIFGFIKKNQENTDRSKRIARAERLIFNASRPDKYPVLRTH